MITFYYHHYYSWAHTSNFWALAHLLVTLIPILWTKYWYFSFFNKFIPNHIGERTQNKNPNPPNSKDLLCPNRNQTPPSTLTVPVFCQNTAKAKEELQYGNWPDSLRGDWPDAGQSCPWGAHRKTMSPGLPSTQREGSGQWNAVSSQAWPETWCRLSTLHLRLLQP